MAILCVKEFYLINCAARLKVLWQNIIFRDGMQSSLIVLPVWIEVMYSACDLEWGPANTLGWSNPGVTAGNILLQMSGIMHNIRVAHNLQA